VPKSSPCEHTTSALWIGTRKLICQGGQALEVDLSADPGEVHARAATEGAALTHLLDFARRTEERRTGGLETDDELTERLRALGYLAD
jgi:hypothetical protein